jgi:competence protein ComEC
MYFAFNNPKKLALKENSGKIISFAGTITSEPLIKDFLQTFTLKTDNGDFVRVGADRYGELRYGDKVKVTGKLSAPRNFEGKGGRVFDYVNYLGKDEIYFEFKKAAVEVTQKNDGKNLSSILFNLKKRFLDNLGRVLGEPHAALAGGLVVGEKAALGKDLIDDFRRAGLIHIVVLSGYNITIIAAMIRRMLSFLPRTAGIILGGIGIVLFGILVGGGATVVRSCIMAIIALSAELLRKDYNVARALFIAALLMLVENPLILFYDPSFQLSFLATLGLIMLSSPFEKRLGFITEKFGIRSLVASTIATQVFVSPLIFYMMGDLSLVGIFVNIVVLPFIPLTMLLVSLAGLLGFISNFLSQISGWGAHILLSYELFMVRNASALPFAVMSLPAFSLRILGGIYAIYGAIFLFARSREKVTKLENSSLSSSN